MITILLLDDDTTACNEIIACAEATGKMKIIDVTNSSHEALKLVRLYLPQVVILELELHHGAGNGLFFLRGLKDLSLEHPPYILVTTKNMSEVVLECARQLGADFTLAKYETGYSAQYVIDNLQLMYPAIQQKNNPHTLLSNITSTHTEQSLIKYIQSELDLIGINHKNKGYYYLIDSIMLKIQGIDSTIARNLISKYNKSEKSIERAMQSAIKQAWRTHDVDDLSKYYTAKIQANKKAPTLKEFICYYANKIKKEVL